MQDPNYGGPNAGAVTIVLPKQVSANVGRFGHRNVVNWRFTFGAGGRVHEVRILAQSRLQSRLVSCSLVPQLQLQHVIRSQKKVIYFNRRQILEDFNNRRMWRWNCSLTRDLVMTVVVDYQSKPGTCQYDLLVRGNPFRKWPKVSRSASQPSRYDRPQ